MGLTEIVDIAHRLLELPAANLLAETPNPQVNGGFMLTKKGFPLLFALLAGVFSPFTAAARSVDTLNRIFNGTEPRIIGSNIRMLEQVTGPPVMSFRDSYGYAIHHYDIGECRIAAATASGNEWYTRGGAHEDTIVMLSVLFWGPDCNFDLDQYGNGLTAASTTGEIAAAVSQNVASSSFTADCGSCPMGIYPQGGRAFLVAQAPRSAGSWTLEVGVSNDYDDSFDDAFRTWLAALSRAHGPEYVASDQFICSPIGDNLYDKALNIFGNFKPTSVSIGDRLPGPGPFGMHPDSPCADAAAGR